MDLSDSVQRRLQGNDKANEDDDWVMQAAGADFDAGAEFFEHIRYCPTVSIYLCLNPIFSSYHMEFSMVSHVQKIDESLTSFLLLSPPQHNKYMFVGRRQKLLSISPMQLITEANQAYINLFRRHSSHGDKTLTYGEFADMLVKAFRRVEDRPTKEELPSLIHRLDRKYTGRITYQDFKVFLAGPALSGVDVKSIRNKIRANAYTSLGQTFTKIFGSYDKDRSGDLSYAELESALKKLGKGGNSPLSPIELQYLCSVLDTDGDGAISLSEFYRFLGPERRAKQALKTPSRKVNLYALPFFSPSAPLSLVFSLRSQLFFWMPISSLRNNKMSKHSSHDFPRSIAKQTLSPIRLSMSLACSSGPEYSATMPTARKSSRIGTFR